MNLLFVFPERILPQKGGVERVSSLIASELARRGHTILFLSLADEGLEKEISPDGIPQLNLSPRLSDFKARLTDLVEKNRVDAVILQGTFNPVLSVLHALPNNIRKYLFLHNQPHPAAGFERKMMLLSPWSNFNLKGKLLKIAGILSPRLARFVKSRRNGAIYRDILAHADRLVLLSDSFKPRLCRYTPGLPDEKICAINNPNTFAPVSSASAEAKENIVLFVARLNHPQKNVTGFIDVWNLFRKTHPGWQALIVGDGEHRDIINAYARRKHTEGLSFEGNRKDVDRYYSKAKILCLTSLYEGWGMVLCEAMAYGCVPVVYESYESVRDIITPGENGLLVPPFNTRKMADSLSALADNPELWKKMSERGKEDIGRFSLDKIILDWERLLGNP